MMEHYLLFKALHIIAIVTWFAGLFYMPRLFVYFAEADLLPEPNRTILQNQFKIMQRRLWYGITWPSSIIAPTFAGFLLSSWSVKDTPWLRIKLWLVVGLYLYQFYLHLIFLMQKRGTSKLSSLKLRVINEISTLFLVSIVFLVVMKDSLSFIYALLGLICLGLVLMISIRVYKHIRPT
jgi:protoporphyrinogen IX oxidase